MTVTIYHNPRCSKSRQTLEIIQSKENVLEIIDYLKEPLTLPALQDLYKKLAPRSAHLMIRSKESEYKEAALNENSDDDTVLKAIAKHPKLLERPIVVTKKGARICRPPELVEEIL